MTQVLIVDDNEQNLYRLQVLLEEHGYRVVSASNGAEALAFARYDPPDMIVTDILMPEMDGFTLCREWKNDPQLKQLPFVFYTATYADPQDERFALSLGAERFIIKPVEPKVLMGILQGVIADYETGQLVAPHDPISSDETVHQEYSVTHVRKLEAKVTELQIANRILRSEINKHKQIQKELGETHQLLETIFDHTHLMVAYLDPHFNFLKVNRAYALADKREPSFFPGKNHFDLYPNAENEAIFRRVVRTKAPHFELAKAFEYAEHPERGISYWDWSLVPVKGADDEVIGLILTLLDVTERIHAEEALRESEARWRSLTENSPDHIVTLDRDLKIQFVNYASPGLTVEELIGTPLYTLVAKETKQAEVKAILEGVLKTGKIATYETEYFTPDGEKICYESRVVPRKLRDKVVGLTLSARDITERKRMEIDEHEQRTLAEALRDTASILTSTLDVDVVMHRILEGVERVVPHDAANIMLIEDESTRMVSWQGYAPHLDDFCRQQRFPLELPNFQQMLNSGQPLLVSDTALYSGWENYVETAWIRSHAAVPIKIHDQIIGFLNLNSATPGFFTKVHVKGLQVFADQAAIALENAQLYQKVLRHADELEQRVAERTAELLHTKERVEAILSSTPDAVLLLRLDGSISQINQAVCKLFGCQDGKELLGSPPTQLVESTYVEVFSDKQRATLESGQNQRLELVAQRTDGSTFDADVAFAPVNEGEVVTGLVCSIRDISVLKEVERMKDAFVSNVSHELRTPITNLILRQHLLTAQPQHLDKHSAVMRREIERLARIIDDLLHLSRLDQRRTTLNFNVVNLNVMLRQYVADRRRLAESQEIGLKVDEAANDVFVQADVGLLEQVLGILLTNALNYTPAGGQVVVSTKLREGDVGWGGFYVRDDGPGISKKEQAQLFSRFFRGEAGRTSGAAGTGLGLAIAHEIVEQHQGRIEVMSEGIPGKGTTFTVWLPTDLSCWQ